MGMGAQNQRGAAAMQPQQQMPMGGAPQGLMALMQQRGKGAGLPGGMPQGGQGGMFGGPRSPAQEMQYQQFMAQQPQMTPMGPMTQQQIGGMSQDMREKMTAMQNQADMQRRLASGDFPGAPGKGGGMPPGRPMGPPPVALVSQPAPGKGGGMPPRPGLPSTMVNPARPQVMPRPMPRPQPVRPKGFDGFR